MSKAKSRLKGLSLYDRRKYTPAKIESCQQRLTLFNLKPVQFDHQFLYLPAFYAKTLAILSVIL